MKRTVLFFATLLLFQIGLLAANNVITYTASNRLVENDSDQGTGVYLDAFDEAITSHTFSKGKGRITFENDITVIGDKAFASCTDLISIVIPKSVKTIGASAFNGCSNLTSITIPNSVTTIGVLAFMGCSSLESFTIPNYITTIETAMFSGCSNLTTIYIPNSVTTIGYCAFTRCGSLTFVNIPNSVSYIDAWAFSSCTSLSSINIPTSISTIGSHAFHGCSDLTEITVNWTDDYQLPEMGEGVFENIAGGTEDGLKNATLYIPDDVEDLRMYLTADVWKEFGTIKTLPTKH